MWQNMNAELPKARQDHVLAARLTRIMFKLRRFCDSPAA
jgi:hypothetical protein